MYGLLSWVLVKCPTFREAQRNLRTMRSGTWRHEAGARGQICLERPSDRADAQSVLL